MSVQFTLNLLEPDANRRGALFERLVGDLFLSLGYEDLRFSVAGTAVELDVVARHRTENRVAIAECKARVAKAGGDELNKFYGALDGWRRKYAPLEVTGYFVSLNGFTESAVEAEREANRLILFDGQTLVAELIKGKIVAPLATAVDTASRAVAGLDEELELDPNAIFLVHDKGSFWVIQYRAARTTPTHYILVHADGELARQTIAREIVEADRETGGPLSGRIRLAPMDEEDESEHLRRYSESLWREFSKIDLDGLPPDPDAPRSVHLEQIYVPTDVNAILADGTRGRDRQPAGVVLERERHLAILANPGSGKSTLLKSIAIAYGCPDRDWKFRELYPAHPWLPILIRCRQLGELARGTIEQIIARVPAFAEMEESVTAFRRAIKRRLGAGEVLLLIDGLDEISDPRDRLLFARQLRTFLGMYPATRLVVTSREPGFRNVANVLGDLCTLYGVAEFDDEDIRQLTLAWHRETGHARDAGAGERLAATILENDRVRQLARNPLLLMTLLLVRRWLGELPRQRTVLYDKAIEVLLMTWNAEAHKALDPDIVPQLAFVAFAMMEKGRKQISRKQLESLLTEARANIPEIFGFGQRLEQVRSLIESVEARSSLLILAGHVVQNGVIEPLYEFRHLTFQEYLAARAVVDGYHHRRTETEDFVEVLRPHLLEVAWIQVVTMAAVLAGAKATALVRHLVEMENAAATNVLAQCLLDDLRISPDVARAACRRLAQGYEPEATTVHTLVNTRYGGVYVEELLDAFQPDAETAFRAGTSISLIAADTYRLSVDVVRFLDVAYLGYLLLPDLKGAGPDLPMWVESVRDAPPQQAMAVAWAIAWWARRVDDRTIATLVTALAARLKRNEGRAANGLYAWALSQLPLVPRADVPRLEPTAVDCFPQHRATLHRAELVIAYYDGADDEQLSEKVYASYRREGFIDRGWYERFLRKLGKPGVWQMAKMMPGDNEHPPRDFAGFILR